MIALPLPGSERDYKFQRIALERQYLLAHEFDLCLGEELAICNELIDQTIEVSNISCHFARVIIESCFVKFAEVLT